MMQSIEALAKSQDFYSDIYQKLMEEPYRQDELFAYAQENGCNDFIDLIMIKYLVITDFSTGEVDIYNVDREADIDEDFIRKLGYSPSSCQWMFCQNLKINHHSKILK